MEKKDDYTVIVSEEAASMLEKHTAFLANVSIDAAQRLVDSFKTAAHSLETMPSRCPWLKSDYIPKNKYRFLVFEKQYMIIFQIIDSYVFADYVIDCRQDYAWLIK